MNLDDLGAETSMAIAAEPNETSGIKDGCGDDGEGCSSSKTGDNVPERRWSNIIEIMTKLVTSESDVVAAERQYCEDDQITRSS